MNESQYRALGVDDDIASLLSAAAAANIPALSDGTPEQARINYARAPKPEGDVLARLRTEDLELERSRLEAAIEVQRLEARRLLVDGDLAGARLAESERRALDGELELVSARLRRAEIVAPIDGTVMSRRRWKRILCDLICHARRRDE